MVDLYQQQGIDKSRILIQARRGTGRYPRRRAARKRRGINYGLTLLFLFCGRACAEAGVYLISPFIGAGYDWYPGARSPLSRMSWRKIGVKSVRNIYDCTSSIAMKPS
ncbi:hypothetical protein KCP71_13890 [Salmonella enterica subsp. enterica]|nr:hypothetical protein KCP71_13890 [Salmonella enterica subsp. enterica]